MFFAYFPEKIVEVPGSLIGGSIKALGKSYHNVRDAVADGIVGKGELSLETIPNQLSFSNSPTY